MKKIFCLFFLLIIPMAVLMMFPVSADDIESISDRLDPIVYQTDGAKVDYKYFGSKGPLGYVKYVTNELYGVPFSGEAQNDDYSKLFVVDSFTMLQRKGNVGDILSYGEDEYAIVVSFNPSEIRITRSCGWDKNNGHSETTVINSSNFDTLIKSCVLWRKNNLDSLYGTSEIPTFGNPYTTVVGNDYAYVRCMYFKNNSSIVSISADWGTDPGKLVNTTDHHLFEKGSDWLGCHLRNLEANKTYYCRFNIAAKNMNDTGIVIKTYRSDIISFTTDLDLQIPSFGDITAIIDNSGRLSYYANACSNEFIFNNTGMLTGTNPKDLKPNKSSSYGEFSAGIVSRCGTWISTLKPNTIYYYSFYFANNNELYGSNIYSFKTPPKHDFESVVIKEPTCTEEGTEELICKDCGLKETRSISPIPHNYIGKIVEPTYIAQGYTEHTCSFCGDIYKNNYTNKLVLDNVTLPENSNNKYFNDHVDLSWNQVDDAQGYLIYEYNFDKDTWIERFRTTSNVTNYSAINLPSGTKYKFGISAYVLVDRKEVSSPEITEIDTTTRPDPVENSWIKSSTDNSVTLKWKKYDKADGYIIYRYINPDDENEIPKTIAVIKDSNANTYKDTNLLSGTKYKYAIDSMVLIEDKYVRSEKSCITSAYTKPATVMGLKTLSTTTDSIKLTWNKIDKADGYIIYRYDSAKKIWSRIAKTDSNINTYTATNLSHGTTYKFAVKAYMTVDEQEYASVKYPILITATNPAAVTGLKSVASSASAVKLSWSKVSGANGYIIYRYNAANRKWVRIAKTKTTANTYLATGLKSGTTYKFAVKAYKTVNGKEISSVSFPQVNTTTTPAAVKYTITAGNKKALLKWGKVTGATGYDVYYKTSANASWQKLTSTKALNFVKTGLATRKTYYFAVRAYRAFGGKNYYGPFTNKSIKIK